MDDKWALPGVDKADSNRPERMIVKSSRLARAFTFIVGLIAVAAIAASAWVYAQTQRDLNRVATDIAQIRLSLQLFGQQQPGSIAVPASETLQDLSNRLAILEQDWRSAAPAGATGPAAAATTGPQTDCIPQGTRFLVASGDSYPICNSPAVVAVSEVGTSYVTFTDGTIVTAGGNGVLKHTQCTITVLSSGADGMTGYAELRANC